MLADILPLKGKSKYETFENIVLFAIVFGAVLLSAGIGLSIFSPKGLPAVFAMLGSFIVFIFSAVLILFWFFKE
jgi:hypothetical protein